MAWRLLAGGPATLRWRKSDRALSAALAATQPSIPSQMNCGVSFPMYGKLAINSAPRHALYAHLIGEKPEATSSGSDTLRQTLAKHGLPPKNATDMLWNFEKFLVGSDGRVLALRARRGARRACAGGGDRGRAGLIVWRASRIGASRAPGSHGMRRRG